VYADAGLKKYQACRTKYFSVGSVVCFLHQLLLSNPSKTKTTPGKRWTAHPHCPLLDTDKSG
jgi:hypothetical protein